MLSAENKCEELVIRPTSNASRVFQKAAAKLTIISVLSRQIGTTVYDQLPGSRGKDKTEEKFDKSIVMSSVGVLKHLPRVVEGSSEILLTDRDVENANVAGVEKDEVENGVVKYGKDDKSSDPFDFMKERKLSEPVLSARKKSGVLNPKFFRCRSTLDLRKPENDKPVVLRELGGYKFYTKASDTSDKREKHNANECDTDSSSMVSTSSEVSALKKTIAELRENFKNREKSVLHLEKKLSLTEQENAKNKKQIVTFKEKLKDGSGTMDYLRREKDVLASERDRLSFMLLTAEHELKELRAQNTNLITEYECVEHSRKIAVGHLQECERVCRETHEVKSDSSVAKKNSEILLKKLSSTKDIVQTLRKERDDLLYEQNKIAAFFTSTLKEVLEQVRDVEAQKKRKLEMESRNNFSSEVIPCSSEEVFVEPETLPADTEDILTLHVFKKKLKSNEQCIDDLANKIRNLEKQKKDLLETRFAMIQKFQSSSDVTGEVEADTSVSDMEEKVDAVEKDGDQKRARVTKKIRKLERTLSMDHGVGKLDCIQKLCKKLEDSEQRIHELEAANSELRTEHEDMEEEAKYLKYVLSYRGDVMKAQLKSEYEKKITALKDEIEESQGRSLKKANNEISSLTKRNQDLEDEVQRLHEELRTLLQNLFSLYAAQGSPSELSEHDNNNFADTSSNSNNSKKISKASTMTVVESENHCHIKGSDDVTLETDSGKPCDDKDHSKDSGAEITFAGNLEDKVAQLLEEKRVLLQSMQLLNNQRESSVGSATESESSAVVKAECTDIFTTEQRYTCLANTLQKMRKLLAEQHEHENDENDETLSKLKNELKCLDEKLTEGHSTQKYDIQKTDVEVNSVHNDRRISELEMEIYRLHEEKKSLLSIIVRLQSDPNFTLSDDVNDSSVVSICDVMVKNDTTHNDDIKEDDIITTKELHLSNIHESFTPLENEVILEDGCSTSKDEVHCATSDDNFLARTLRDEGVQVNINRDDVRGLLGYLEQGLDKLRNALDDGNLIETKPQNEETLSHDPHMCPCKGSLQDLKQLNKELKNLGQHTQVLEEKLEESESIRCDLHRTISIATDMATEERQKCEELKRTKAALEKEMLTLAKENRDLRDGLETLSISKKRRGRNQRSSLASDTQEEDCHVTYLPRAKAQNISESELSDIESPSFEFKSFPRNP